MTVQEQAHAWLTMMATGAAMGAVYDALGALHALLRGGKVFRAALDGLFALGCAAAVIGAALMERMEAFRWFVFAAALVGWAGYRLTLGTIVRVLERRISIICETVKKSRKMDEKCE